MLENSPKGRQSPTAAVCRFKLIRLKPERVASNFGAPRRLLSGSDASPARFRGSITEILSGPVSGGTLVREMLHHPLHAAHAFGDDAGCLPALLGIDLSPQMDHATRDGHRDIEVLQARVVVEAG